MEPGGPDTELAMALPGMLPSLTSRERAPERRVPPKPLRGILRRPCGCSSPEPYGSGDTPEDEDEDSADTPSPTSSAKDSFDTPSPPLSPRDTFDVPAGSARAAPDISPTPSRKSIPHGLRRLLPSFRRLRSTGSEDGPPQAALPAAVLLCTTAGALRRAAQRARRPKDELLHGLVSQSAAPRDGPGEGRPAMAQEPPRRRVCFCPEKTDIYYVTPYSSLYGVHPSLFEFDREGDIRLTCVGIEEMIRRSEADLTPLGSEMEDWCRRTLAEIEVW